MSIYIVIVWLLVPASQGNQPLQLELHRELISASSPSVCQQFASKRAEEQREKNAEQVRRMGARVEGKCTVRDAT